MVRVYSQPGQAGHNSLGGIFDGGGGHQVRSFTSVTSFLELVFPSLDVHFAFFSVLLPMTFRCVLIQSTGATRKPRRLIRIFHKNSCFSLTFVQRQCFSPPSSITQQQQPACSMMMPPLGPVTPRARVSSSSSSTSPSPSPSRLPTDLKASVQLGLCRSCKRFYRKPEV